MRPVLLRGPSVNFSCWRTDSRKLSVPCQPEIVKHCGDGLRPAAGRQRLLPRPENIRDDRFDTASIGPRGLVGASQRSWSSHGRKAGSLSAESLQARPSQLCTPGSKSSEVSNTRRPCRHSSKTLRSQSSIVLMHPSAVELTRDISNGVMFRGT